MNRFQQLKRAWNLASDWRYNNQTITLGKKEIKRNQAVNLTAKLDVVTKQLTQKAIADWRRANQYAINVDTPNRSQLYLIYDDAMHDLHLKGAIRNRKLAVLGMNFKLVDDNGEINKDATKLLKKKWVRQFMSHAMDSKFYGHSLIQFGDVDREKMVFKDVELIPRHHVSPEYGMLLENVSDDPRKGIPYRDTPLMDWAIEVGTKYFLGELNSVAKETISKKYVLQFWDQFAEIFGMPIRVGKTTSRNPEDKAAIENMLDKMGSAAWALFPEGTTLELIASKQTDAYEVYDKRVERANSEMSKSILGQTMTMDDGSSLSQAQVHEGVADEIADADRTDMHDVMNDDLLPFLVKHGWPVDNLTFEWDDTYHYTPQEMTSIEEMLLGHYDIPGEYFTDKYGVTINGAKQQTPPTNLVHGELVEPKKKASTQLSLPSWVIDMPTD